MLAGASPQRPGRRLAAPLIAIVLVTVGAGLLGVSMHRALAWRDGQRSATSELREIEAERAQDGETSPRHDAAVADAIDRIEDDDRALLAAGLFAGGAIAFGAGVGTAIGRVRRRRARVALHPSLVAASDRKLERLLAEHAQDLVTMLDVAGRFTYVSPSVTTILGYDPDDMLGKRFDVYLDAASLDQAEGDRRTGEPLRHRARHADGEVRWLETLSHRIQDERAGVMSLYSSRDVTERVRLEETLVAERRLLGDTLANVHAGVLSVDLDGRVIDANGEFCAMVGFRPVPGAPVVEIEGRYGMLDADGIDVAIHDRPLLRSTLGESVKQFAATLVAVDGSRRDVMATAGPLIGSDGRRNGAVLTVHDVSELRAAEAELRSLATVDVLTGLPNRRHLEAALADAMERNVETPERIALLFLDLDGFKGINDTFGHEIGDEVLKLVGSRIVTCLRGHDVVARLGGDEFVVLVEHLNAPTDIAPLAARIEVALAEPIELPVLADPDDADSVVLTRIRMGASIGTALGQDVRSPAELLARADAVMYERKRERPDRHRSPSSTASGSLGPSRLGEGELVSGPG